MCGGKRETGRTKGRRRRRRRRRRGSKTRKKDATGSSTEEGIAGTSVERPARCSGWFYAPATKILQVRVVVKDFKDVAFDHKLAHVRRRHRGDSCSAAPHAPRRDLLVANVVSVSFQFLAFQLLKFQRSTVGEGATSYCLRRHLSSTLGAQQHRAGFHAPKYSR